MFRYCKTEAVLRLLLRLFWKFEKILIILRYLRALFNKTIFQMLWHSLLKMASMHLRSGLKKALFSQWLAPNFKVSTPNFVKKAIFSYHLGVWGVFRTFRGIWPPIHYHAAFIAASKLQRTAKNCVQVETALRWCWRPLQRPGLKKLSKNMFFLIKIYKTLI